MFIKLISDRVASFSNDKENNFNNIFRMMIQCEACTEWFHSKCVGLRRKAPAGEWHCPKCKDVRQAKLSAARLQKFRTQTEFKQILNPTVLDEDIFVEPFLKTDKARNAYRKFGPAAIDLTEDKSAITFLQQTFKAWLPCDCCRIAMPESVLRPNSNKSHQNLCETAMLCRACQSSLVVRKAPKNVQKMQFVGGVLRTIT